MIYYIDLGYEHMIGAVLHSPSDRASLSQWSQDDDCTTNIVLYCYYCYNVPLMRYYQLDKSSWRRVFSVSTRDTMLHLYRPTVSIRLDNNEIIPLYASNSEINCIVYKTGLINVKWPG